MNIAKNKTIDFTLLDIHPDVMAIFKIAFLDKFFNIQSRQDFLKQHR
jgi:anti-anti-sigma regulatory factor